MHKFTVDLPKKHGRGGQSALRFARLRSVVLMCYLALVSDSDRAPDPTFITKPRLQVIKYEYRILLFCGNFFKAEGNSPAMLQIRIH